ncbi:MAG: ribosome small subunit-dependent GTPase A, partial [Akkermansiaceae bacterium]|nr:ribosome small subunit-dependent GTPase A [Akkermansiaceae bacterium]
MNLKELGWNPGLQEALEQYAGKNWVPARLIRETVINYGAFL